MRNGVYDPQKFSTDDLMKVTMTIGFLLDHFENETASITGAVQIIDVANLSAGHILQMTPAISKKMMVFSQVKI